MAYDYNKYKSVYEGLNDDQRQKWDTKYGNTEQYKQFKADYANEKWFQQQTQTVSDPKQQAYTGNTQQATDKTMDEYKKQNPQWEVKTQTPEQIQESINNAQKNIKNQNVSPELDQTKFSTAPEKVTVKEWTAAQTGMPDYQAESEARNREITDNLNYYWENNKDYFSTREKFNNIFHYNERNDSQKAILDSYWKKKEDVDYVSQFNSWESLYRWMNNWQVTTDQLNLLKETDPKAYQAWQEKQEEEIKKRIINDIVPPVMEEISTNMINMMNNLGIQPQDALDIEGIYNSTMTELGAYQTLADANNTVKKIEEVINKKTAIMNRYASSTWGTVSDALAAARMQKAIAPYNEQLNALQYQYQDYANLYNQKLATATQAAQVRQAQAQENQRVWQQRLTALWFAADAMSYRTPEQKAQLELQKQQALNEESLLYQSKLNDLNRYNTYATAKLNNKLQAELTDLSVEDEQQLKANLNNILSDYYKNYGDIIQRSQPQAVEDIIAYAKKNWISVAQALTESFIKPLQNKKEYKQKVATDYGMLSKQSIATINWRNVIMTTNPDGSISYQYIDSWITDSYTIDGVEYVVYNWKQMTAAEFNEKYWGTVWTVKPYDMVDSKVFDTSPVSHSYYTLADFLIDPNHQEWKRGWQCASFVNDYLERIWVGRYFGTEDAKTRASRCNSDTAKVWTIAVFDYNHYTDWKNYGHVWIVVDTDANGFRVLDSNYDTKNPWTIQKRYVRYGSSSCKGFFDPSQPPRTSTTTKWVWGLTADQITALAWEYIDWTKTYSDIKTTYWEKVLNAVWLKASELAENWYEKSKIITDPAKILTAEQNLMTKFNSMNDWNKEALSQANKMQQALDTISADKRNNKKSLNVASQTIVTAFNKLLDENSVVRESEYSRTPEWQSYLEKLQGKYEQLTKWWAWLTYDNLKAAVDLANKFAVSYQENQNQLAQLIRNQAKTYWLNESNILPLDVIQQLDNPTNKSTTTWPVDTTTKYFDWLQSTMTTNTWAWSVTSDYMYSKVDFILNGIIKDAN